ncbi:hypothetical protein [Cellulomonas telluris]|uniref:hypothetical protein n=1 Tax=Cellulomonas telluris TaxID=2306636 RepID=UPI0010A8A9F1|nr:hypothetical protein [Cellulomonas telluris]
MKRHHLPLVLLTASALLLAPATAASATGDGDHRWGTSTWHGWPGKGDHGKPGKGDHGKPGKGQPTPRPELCGGSRAGEVIPWHAYTCDKATGYFLYEKKDPRQSANWSNSKQQHRVALHLTWAWPTADDRQRHGASHHLPRDYDVIPLELDATDTAAVCEAPEAYGLQVDLIGDFVADRGLDVASLMPTVITPPHDGGFNTPHTLAFYGHYDVAELVDLDELCAPDVEVPPVVPTPVPTPTPTPTDDVEEEPEPVVTPTPTPAPTQDVEEEPAPAPVVTTTPTPVAAPVTPAPTPSVTERAEVLSAADDDDASGSNRGQVLAATGTSVLVGLLAAVAAVAAGAVLMILRRRGRTTEA